MFSNGRIPKALKLLHLQMTTKAQRSVNEEDLMITQGVAFIGVSLLHPSNMLSLT
jgi:hypothetical protein